MKRTARDILRDKRDNMLTVDMEATVHQAVTLMTQQRVGAILIVDAGRIVGIWTERDLLHRTVDPHFDPRTEKVSQSMTRALISAHLDEQVMQLYDKFVGRRIRHLLIEDGGEYVGLLSAGDVMRANLQQRADEYRALNEMVSLEYYEGWKAQQAEALR